MMIVDTILTLFWSNTLSVKPSVFPRGSMALVRVVVGGFSFDLYGVGKVQLYVYIGQYVLLMII